MSQLNASESMKPLLYVGPALGNYGFPNGHPLSIDRQGAFWREARRLGLHERALIERFHAAEYVDRVITLSKTGTGYLDYGDTPAIAGMYETAAAVVGSALDAAARILRGEARRSFQPIGGLHHARRDRAAGFCVFNDLGVLIETLRSEYGIQRIAYVDIDVHHGDGVFYEFGHDPNLIVVDIHQDGNTLYPGTGHSYETGQGAAAGTKLNLPLRPGAIDAAFMWAWQTAEQFLQRQQPEFYILQCGADGLAGDPLANLRLSAAAHAHAAQRLVALSAEHAQGRLMAFGGGGYELNNLARAWCAVLEQFA
jgi:acetoin utilization protein AcuC